MKVKLFVAILVLVFFSACKIDDGIDCALVDCATDQIFSIEFKDAEGTNLITNETYKLEDIEITSGDRQLELVPLDTTKLVTFIISRNIGETSYTIKLNSSETDTLVLDTKQQQNTNFNQCCPPLLFIEKAIYNENQKEIVKMDNGFEKIIVVK